MHQLLWLSGMTHTYGSYLKVDALLDLQRPLSNGPEHDEMLFIVIHQVYELWFKQILHEMQAWGTRLEAGDVHRAQHTMGRILRILKVMVAQIDILETMTPLEFSSFRDTLATASGFQSVQFRELESVLGFRDKSTLAPFAEHSRERARILERQNAPSVWESFIRYLLSQGYKVTPEHHDESQDSELLRMYRTDPETANLAERLVDLDEGISEWRYRHIKMVQRTIGVKMGTGGSPGVAYLQSTLKKVAFPALWRIRASM